ncbi:MAG: hypothetical protein AAGD22_03720, partial [Verrucomicrobiota bacterium]
MIPARLPLTLALALLLAPDPLGAFSKRRASAQATANAGIKLSAAQAKTIGQKIWQNECGGTIEGLTSWNAGENFASLGIGHFIWYHNQYRGPFDESFPKLIAYMKQRRVKMPAWLANARTCPWTSRSQFLAAQNSPQMRELRSFLADTVPVQTDFIVRRLEQALPKMLNEVASPQEKNLVRGRFYAVAETTNGVYALIDYVNFKGEGTKPTERYKGQGWGLLQVLENMKGTPRGQDAAKEFSESAKRT